MLAQEMPARLQPAITEMSDTKMQKVMDMMKVRLRYHTDIQNHKYLFEEPDYSTELGLKFQKKIKRSSEVNLQILKDISESLAEKDDSNFSAEVMNEICSEYVDSHGKLSTEDVFYLVRFALSGNPVGAPMADIAEVVGHAQVQLRLQ